MSHIWIGFDCVDQKEGQFEGTPSCIPRRASVDSGHADKTMKHLNDEGMIGVKIQNARASQDLQHHKISTP